METSLTNDSVHRSAGQTLTGVLLKPDSDPPADISIAQVFRVLRRRRFCVLACLGAVLALAGMYCILAPRRYEAVGRVVINNENSNPLGIAVAEFPIPLQDTSLVQETQVRILQSDAVAWDVIRQLRLNAREELAGNAASSSNALEDATPAVRQRLLASFRQRLAVRSVPKTQIVEVSFRSADPKLAADVVNGVAKAYVERNFRTRFNATMQASDWLGRQLDDLKARVESKQQEFVEFQKKTGIVGSDETHNIIVSRLDELNRHLATAQSERIVREARYRQALEADPAVIVELAPGSALDVLRRQQAELKTELAQLTSKYGNSYPKVAQMRAQLAQVEAALQAETRTVRQRLETEFRAAAKAESMANSEVERQRQEAYKLNEAGIHFLILKRELEGSRDLYEDLQKKLKEAGIVAGLRSTNVNVVDPAEVPLRPAEPRVPLTLTLATLLGGLLGIAVAFSMENLDATISDPQLAETLAEVPLMGIVPHLRFPPDARSRTLPASLPSRSSFAESFRVLRSTLMLATPAKPPKVILVTSALPGEGKTIVSANVARSLAQNGRQVLLLDGDLRHEAPHKSGFSSAVMLAQHQTGGLSDCIIGAAEPDTAVISLPELPNLSVLAAGERPSAPVELLDSVRMRELVRYWRDKYDHIIIDATPVLGLSDALVLATMADAVLLVARHRRTGRQSLCRARDALRRIAVQPLGIVFNDLDVNSGQHYEYYGYYGRTYSRYYAEDGSGRRAN